MAETWRSAPDATGLWWLSHSGGVSLVKVICELMHVVIDGPHVSPWGDDAGWLWLRCERPTADILAPGEPTRAEIAAQLAAVTRERDVALGQIGPLLDAHDALVAAARAAGWTGAGATGAELVAWVRRGEREACAARCEREADAVHAKREGMDQRAASYVAARVGALRQMARRIREGGE